MLSIFPSSIGMRHSSRGELYAQGNNTPEFLGFIFAYGVANGAPYPFHDYLPM